MAANYTAKQCKEQKNVISVNSVEIWCFVTTVSSLNLILWKNVERVPGPTQPPLQWITGGFPAREKCLERGPAHLPLSDI